jgi:hypothetical protein
MRVASLLGISAVSLSVGVGVGAGCGGNAFSTGSDAGGADSGKDSGAGGGEAGRDGAADAAVDCNALLLALNEDRDRARACCAACQLAQCTQTARDLCCPISVDDATSPSVVAFEAALTAYIQACGAGECPAGLCPKAPSDICGSTARCN